MKHKVISGTLILIMIITLCAYKEVSYTDTSNTAQKKMWAEPLIVGVSLEVSASDDSTEENEDIVDEDIVEEDTIEPTEEQTTEGNSMLYNISQNDYYLLAKIAMAEAEGEDTVGKAYVIMVILNRMSDSRFPDTIEGVIFQEDQFSPTSNGRFDRVEPSEDCYEALKMVTQDGWDESRGALYFESCPNPDNWHSRNLEYLFTHGNHRFYR